MAPANDAAVSPKVWREWREALAILIAGLALCFLLDAVIFRTRFSTRILDPHTSTGSLEFALSTEASREYWARHVLVLGNSIIVQGFSARLANWSQQARGYQFSSLAAPATWESTRTFTAEAQRTQRRSGANPLGFFSAPSVSSAVNSCLAR